MRRCSLKLVTSAVPILTIALSLVWITGINGREKVELKEVARSERQWTGVAVSTEGRIFVSYPRWSDNVPFSVGELMPDGEVKPFPDKGWNAWVAGLSPKEHLICVQSVYIDGDNSLWILDAANPKFEGVIKDGPKLLKIDLKTNRIVRTIYFDESVAPYTSYLNDVRIDTKKGYAYLTDSGTGALITINLSDGRARRVMGNHFSTECERIVVKINGKVWRRTDGRIPRFHVDGIALDKAGKYLYYHALSGLTLYRINTKLLQDTAPDEQNVKIEAIEITGPVDGMEFGPDGNLYLAAIEDSSIKRITPAREFETVIQDPRLAWPDSLAVGPDGFIYVTTSQTHWWDKPPGPYRLFKFKPL